MLFPASDAPCIRRAAITQQFTYRSTEEGLVDVVAQVDLFSAAPYELSQPKNPGQFLRIDQKQIHYVHLIHLLRR